MSEHPDDELPRPDHGREREPGRHESTRPEEERRNRFARLGEQLSGFLDPESALRRGQGLVTGVSRATKEELMRIVGAEVRNFLDKMDIADLAQQIVAGLDVDVHMKVKFSRHEEPSGDSASEREDRSDRSGDEAHGERDPKSRS